MKDGTGEYDRGDKVEAILSDSSFFKLFPQSSAFSFESFMFGVRVSRKR